MATNSFSSSTKSFQDFLGKFPPRKLLIQNPINEQPIAAAPTPYPLRGNLHFNVVMFLSVLVSAIICSLGCHLIIRFVFLKCLKLLESESNTNSSTQSGNKYTGIKKKTLEDFPVVIFSTTELKLPSLETECVICLSEFMPGERLRILPKCNHGFHVHCIDKWLRSHSSCPKCRHCLTESCQISQASSTGHSVPVPEPESESVVSIRPLEPEAAWAVRDMGMKLYRAAKSNSSQ